MPITNGTISVLRRVRTGDFEHIEPHVTLSFTVEPHEEDPVALARAVSQLVDTEYRYLLNPAQAEQYGKPAFQQAAEAAKEKTPRGKRTNPGDVVIPAGPVPAAAVSLPGAAQQTAPTTAPVTASVPSPNGSVIPLGLPGAPAPSPQAVEQPATVASASTAGTATAALPVAPVPGAAIANVALNDAVMHRLTQLFPLLGERAQPKIMELIGEYTGTAANLADVPQERRQEFLDRLKALA